MPVSCEGPLTTINPFRFGGVIFCTSTPFSTISLRVTYSFFCAAMGAIDAENFTCAHSIPQLISKKKNRIIFIKESHIVTVKTFCKNTLCKSAQCPSILNYLNKLLIINHQVVALVRFPLQLLVPRVCCRHIPLQQYRLLP